MEEILAMRKKLDEMERQLLLSTNKKPSLKLNPIQSDRETYRKTILTKYTMVTITFDPKILNNHDTAGQHILLKKCLELLHNYHYYSCFEKHNSGILHCHFMTNASPHDLQPILYKMLKIVSTSKFLLPAIRSDLVKDTQIDINRTYDYIWNDKKDHPLYKFMQINI